MSTTFDPMPRPGRLSDLEDSIQAILGDDHRRIREFLDEIVALAGEEDPRDFTVLWNTFELDTLTHLHAEEVHVFRAFRRAEPQETAQLVEEHQRIRNRLTELSIALDLHCLRAEQVAALADEIRAHVQREERLLYPWASRQLDKVARSALLETLSASRAERLARALQTWQVDASRSTLTFALRHALFGEVTGRFTSWGGTLSIDPTHPTASGAFIWIDLASIQTGDAARDAQARSAEFFDVERFPQARFSTQRIRLPDVGNPIVEGRMALHGVERNVALEIVDRRDVIVSDGPERSLYTVKGRIDRRDFGLRWSPDLDLRGLAVGAQVELEAQLEVVLQQPALET